MAEDNQTSQARALTQVETVKFGESAKILREGNIEKYLPIASKTEITKLTSEKGLSYGDAKKIADLFQDISLDAKTIKEIIRETSKKSEKLSDKFTIIYKPIDKTSSNLLLTTNHKKYGHFKSLDQSNSVFNINTLTEGFSTSLTKDTKKPSPFNRVNVNENSSKKNPHLSGILIDDPSVRMGLKNTLEMSTFLNSISTIEFSRAQPYFNGIFILPNKVNKNSSSKLKTASINQFLFGSDFSKHLANDTFKKFESKSRMLEISKIEKNNDSFESKTDSVSMVESNMSLFTSPQTMINADEHLGHYETVKARFGTNYERGATPRDSMLPFMTLKDFSVDVAPTRGLMSYKTAKLSLVLHDKNRMIDIAPLIKPDLFGAFGSEVVIEYGWKHPDGNKSDSKNTIGKFLESSRCVDKFMIVNSSFTIDNNGMVNIDLALAAKGPVMFKAIEILKVPEVASFAGTSEKINEEIQEILRELSVILEDNSANKDRFSGFSPIKIKDKPAVSFFDISDTNDIIRSSKRKLPSDVLNHLIEFVNKSAEYANIDLTNEAIGVEISDQSAIYKFLPFFNFDKDKLQRKQTTADMLQKVIELKDALIELIKLYTEMVVFTKSREESENVFLKSIIGGAIIADPYWNKNLRELLNSDEIYGHGSETYKKTKSYLIEDPKEDTNVIQDYISLGSVISTLIGNYFLNGLNNSVDEVQMIFYTANENAGAMSNTNLSSILISTTELKDLLDNLSLDANNKLKIITLESLLAKILKELVHTPRNISYGLRDLYDLNKDNIDNENLSKERKEIETKVIESQKSRRLAKIYGNSDSDENKLVIPSINFNFDSLTTSNNSEKTICRISIYDRHDHPYKPLSDLIKSYTTLGSLEEANKKASKLFQDKKTNKNLSDIETFNKRREILINDLVKDGIISEDKKSIKGKYSKLKENFIKKYMPYTKIGTQNSAIINGSLSTINEAKLNTVYLTRPDRNLEINDKIKTDLPLRVMPAQAQVELYGCPWARFSQNIFLDFGTETSVDNRYIITGLNHNISPGKFTTSLKLSYGDFYGPVENSLNNITALINKSMGERELKNKREIFSSTFGNIKGFQNLISGVNSQDGFRFGDTRSFYRLTHFSSHREKIKLLKKLGFEFYNEDGTTLSNDSSQPSAGKDFVLFPLSGGENKNYTQIVFNPTKDMAKSSNYTRIAIDSLFKEQAGLPIVVYEDKEETKILDKYYTTKPNTENIGKLSSNLRSLKNSLEIGEGKRFSLESGKINIGKLYRIFHNGIEVRGQINLINAYVNLVICYNLLTGKKLKLKDKTSSSFEKRQNTLSHGGDEGEVSWTNSRHVYGEGIDFSQNSFYDNINKRWRIDPNSAVTPNDKSGQYCINVMYYMSLFFGFRGFGIGNGTFHIDLRPTRAPVNWVYHYNVSSGKTNHSSFVNIGKASSKKINIGQWINEEEDLKKRDIRNENNKSVGDIKLDKHVNWITDLWYPYKHKMTLGEYNKLDAVTDNNGQYSVSKGFSYLPESYKKSAGLESKDFKIEDQMVSFSGAVKFLQEDLKLQEIEQDSSGTTHKIKFQIKFAQEYLDGLIENIIKIKGKEINSLATNDPNNENNQNKKTAAEIQEEINKLLEGLDEQLKINKAVIDKNNFPDREDKFYLGDKDYNYSIGSKSSTPIFGTYNSSQDNFPSEFVKVLTRSSTSSYGNDLNSHLQLLGYLQNSINSLFHRIISPPGDIEEFVGFLGKKLFPVYKKLEDIKKNFGGFYEFMQKALNESDVVQDGDPVEISLGNIKYEEFTIMYLDYFLGDNAESYEGIFPMAGWKKNSLWLEIFKRLGEITGTNIVSAVGSESYLKKIRAKSAEKARINKIIQESQEKNKKISSKSTIDQFKLLSKDEKIKKIQEKISINNKDKSMSIVDDKILNYIAIKQDKRYKLTQNKEHIVTVTSEKVKKAVSLLDLPNPNPNQNQNSLFQLENILNLEEPILNIKSEASNKTAITTSNQIHHKYKIQYSDISSTFNFNSRTPDFYKDLLEKDFNLRANVRHTSFFDGVERDNPFNIKFGIAPDVSTDTFFNPDKTIVKLKPFIKDIPESTSENNYYKRLYSYWLLSYYTDFYQATNPISTPVFYNTGEYDSNQIHLEGTLVDFTYPISNNYKMYNNKQTGIRSYIGKFSLKDYTKIKSLLSDIGNSNLFSERLKSLFDAQVTKDTPNSLGLPDFSEETRKTKPTVFLNKIRGLEERQNMKFSPEFTETTFSRKIKRGQGNLDGRFAEFAKQQTNSIQPKGDQFVDIKIQMCIIFQKFLEDNIDKIFKIEMTKK